MNGTLYLECGHIDGDPDNLADTASGECHRCLQSSPWMGSDKEVK